ncbi:unnamed protein product, partial [marine sediment metagenome]
FNTEKQGNQPIIPAVLREIPGEPSTYVPDTTSTDGIKID